MTTGLSTAIGINVNVVDHGQIPTAARAAPDALNAESCLTMKSSTKTVIARSVF